MLTMGLIIVSLCCVWQVESSTRLFPAVFIKPTSANMFQFELGRVKVHYLTQIDHKQTIKCFFYTFKVKVHYSSDSMNYNTLYRQPFCTIVWCVLP